MPLLELEKEFQYYLDHQDQLVKSHYGRYIIIKDEKVLGDFGTTVEAIIYARDKLNLKLGSFLVQHCLPSEENYIPFFYSARQFIFPESTKNNFLVAHF